jgi:ABC-2 type transport system permease protein
VLVLGKDLLRRLRSPLAPAIFLLFPVVFALLIGATFGREGKSLAPIRLALVDADGGLAARAVRAAFQQQGDGPRFDITETDSARAVALVEDDRVAAALWIPAGFTSDLLDGRTARFVLLENPAQPIYAGIAEEYVNVVALLGSGAARVLGEPGEQLRASIQGSEPPSAAEVSAIAVAINERISGVARYILPPAIRLEAAADTTTRRGLAAEADSPFQVALFVLPGMSVFALLTLALISLSDLHRERVLGTLARQLAAPVPMRAVLLGKVLATWVLSLACIAIIAVVALFWVKRSVSIPGFLALSLAFALAATGFSATVHALTRSERTSTTIGSIVIMAMSMVGGSWIPLDLLPDAVRSIAPLTLAYWGNQGYRDVLFAGAGVVDLAPSLGILTALGVLFCGIALVRLRATHAGR